MPKLRPKSNFQKRFRVTKNGKVLFNSVGDAKLHAKKSRSKKRRYGKTEVLGDKTVAKKIIRSLGV